EVLQGPDASGGRFGSQLDLRHVPVMDGDDVSQDLLEPGHEVVGALYDAVARVGGVDVHVVGEHLAHVIPFLGVHQPEVPGLELLEGLDVVHTGTVRRPRHDGPVVAGSILVLGGTRFLGRAVVAAALASKESVTLFNRGITAPDLFPEATHLRGDRLADVSALTDGTWDIVVDVAAYEPRAAELSVASLQGRVGRYVFVSTVSVYADHSIPQVEGAPLETDPDS